MNDLVAYIEEKWDAFESWMTAQYGDHGREMAEERYQELKRAAGQS